MSEGVVVTSEEDSGFLESAFRGRDYSPAERCEESNARELQKDETRRKTIALLHSLNKTWVTGKSKVSRTSVVRDKVSCRGNR